jgi:hypothetical protein
LPQPTHMEATSCMRMLSASTKPICPFPFRAAGVLSGTCNGALCLRNGQSSNGDIRELYVYAGRCVVDAARAFPEAA